MYGTRTCRLSTNSDKRSNKTIFLQFINNSTWPRMSMAQNHRTLPSSLSTSAIRHNSQRIEKNVRQQNNWDFCLGISVWGATYVKHGLPQSNSHSQAGHRPHSIIHPAVPPSWTGPSPCLLCFLSSSASAWARSAPVPPRRQPPAPPTAQSCGGTSKSGQVSDAPP